MKSLNFFINPVGLGFSLIIIIGTLFATLYRQERKREVLIMKQKISEDKKNVKSEREYNIFMMKQSYGMRNNLSVNNKSQNNKFF